MKGAGAIGIAKEEGFSHFSWGVKEDKRKEVQRI